MDTRPACISLERRNHIIASAVEASINSRREAGEGIGDCQRPNFSAFGQLVVNEVHGPDMVGMSRFRTVGPSFAFTTLGNLVAELEVHLPVKAISTRPRVTRLKISNYRSVDVPARCPHDKERRSKWNDSGVQP